ncbi:MAG: hypothetical protein R3195_04055 [Gemmatimonadota bacterium]|nr:hypothetical protein [Gemmatimonadota bacterium]
MFETLGMFLWLVITGIASIGGYMTMKRFVRERLRFVDGVHRKPLPAIAGAAATAVALPFTILPIVNMGTALLFGIGIATGVSAGRRELKKLPGA